MFKLSNEAIVAIMGAIENGRAIDIEWADVIYPVLEAAIVGSTIEIVADEVEAG